MEKLYRYAAAPNGGLEEAKMLANANGLGREFSDSINTDTAVISLIEHAVSNYHLKNPKWCGDIKPKLYVPHNYFDFTVIPDAVKNGFYKVDINVTFYEGFFELGWRDLHSYKQGMREKLKLPRIKASLMAAGNRIKVGSPKYKLMMEYSRATITDEFVTELKSCLMEVLHKYCTPDWSMIKFVFHH